jgi:hypothetical protein
MVVKSVSNCVGCKNDHGEFEFLELPDPCNVDGDLMTHAGVCPESHEKVFMREQ